MGYFFLILCFYLPSHPPLCHEMKYDFHFFPPSLARKLSLHLCNVFSCMQAVILNADWLDALQLLFAAILIIKKIPGLSLILDFKLGCGYTHYSTALLAAKALSA